MRSDEEILQAPRALLTPDEYRRHGELVDRGLAEARAEREYLRGRLVGLRASALQNEGLRESLRLRAWLEQGERFERVEDAPEGWPESVDADEYVAATVDAALETPAPDEEATGSVAEFRRAIGDE